MLQCCSQLASWTLLQRGQVTALEREETYEGSQPSDFKGQFYKGEARTHNAPAIVNYGYKYLGLDQSKPIEGLPRYFFHNYYGRISGKIEVPDTDMYQFVVRASREHKLQHRASPFYFEMAQHLDSRRVLVPALLVLRIPTKPRLASSTKKF